ncbi:MAG TPA: hypothetical protein DDY17_11300 [Syntrophaceae bacterium]|nr:hypothetical protein [Syntrophaceae bacterium]
MPPLSWIKKLPFCGESIRVTFILCQGNFFTKYGKYCCLFPEEANTVYTSKCQHTINLNIKNYEQKRASKKARRDGLHWTTYSL